MTDEMRAREIVNAWLPQPVTAKAATSLAEAIAAALSSARAEGFGAGIERSWQPMHTAPRDGTLIDLLYPYPRGRTVNCFWDSGAIHGPGWFWRTPRWDGGDLLPKEEWPLNCYPNMEPTHWMPAPPMPTDGATHGDH